MLNHKFLDVCVISPFLVAILVHLLAEGVFGIVLQHSIHVVSAKRGPYLVLLARYWLEDMAGDPLPEAVHVLHRLAIVKHVYTILCTTARQSALLY